MWVVSWTHITLVNRRGIPLAFQRWAGSSDFPFNRVAHLKNLRVSFYFGSRLSGKLEFGRSRHIIFHLQTATVLTGVKTIEVFKKEDTQDGVDDPSSHRLGAPHKTTASGTERWTGPSDGPFVHRASPYPLGSPDHHSRKSTCAGSNGGRHLSVDKCSMVCPRALNPLALPLKHTTMCYFPRTTCRAYNLLLIVFLFFLQVCGRACSDESSE
jgi:hypothetical protein